MIAQPLRPPAVDCRAATAPVPARRRGQQPRRKSSCNVGSSASASFKRRHTQDLSRPKSSPTCACRQALLAAQRAHDPGLFDLTESRPGLITVEDRAFACAASNASACAHTCVRLSSSATCSRLKPSSNTQRCASTAPLTSTDPESPPARPRRAAAAALAGRAGVTRRTVGHYRQSASAADRSSASHPGSEHLPHIGQTRFILGRRQRLDELDLVERWARECSKVAEPAAGDAEGFRSVHSEHNAQRPPTPQRSASESRCRLADAADHAASAPAARSSASSITTLRVRTARCGPPSTADASPILPASPTRPSWK